MKAAHVVLQVTISFCSKEPLRGKPLGMWTSPPNSLNPQQWLQEVCGPQKAVTKKELIAQMSDKRRSKNAYRFLTWEKGHHCKQHPLLVLFQERQEVLRFLLKYILMK